MIDRPIERVVDLVDPAVNRLRSGFFAGSLLERR